MILSNLGDVMYQFTNLLGKRKQTEMEFQSKNLSIYQTKSISIFLIYLSN